MKKKKKKKIFNNLLKKCGYTGEARSVSVKTGTLVSLLFSIYMGKKNFCLVRSDAEKAVAVHKKNMTRKFEVDLDFVRFLKKEIHHIFEGYKYKVNNRLVPPSTFYHYKGQDVPGIHDFLIHNNINKEDFDLFWEKDEVSPGMSEIYEDFFKQSCSHKVKVVQEKGKIRVITTNHVSSFLMKNLQWSVHNWLRNKRIFRYIGMQVNTEVCIGGIKEEDEVLSGDYSNSTDYIPTELTRIVWETILEHIHGRKNIKALVHHTLKDGAKLEYDDEVLSMTSGQLMGGLLSFPSLCLINHAITKYLGINKKKINGDDLLALCKKEDKKKWSEGALKFGMLPNEEKSHIHPYWGTFNSQLIRKKGLKLYRIPHVQIAKLEAASLKDWLGLNLNKNHYIKEIIGHQVNVWMKMRKNIDLYTGDIYEGAINKEINKYNNFFARFHKYFAEEKELYHGRVGGFSKFFNEDIDAMIKDRWSHLDEDMEDFTVGSGIIFFLEKLWREKDVNFYYYFCNTGKKAKHAGITRPTLPDEIETVTVLHELDT